MKKWEAKGSPRRDSNPSPGADRQKPAGPITLSAGALSGVFGTASDWLPFVERADRRARTGYEVASRQFLTQSKSQVNGPEGGPEETRRTHWAEDQGKNKKVRCQRIAVFRNAMSRYTNSLRRDYVLRISRVTPRKIGNSLRAIGNIIWIGSKSK
jgi:hypothetical protein